MENQKIACVSRSKSITYIGAIVCLVVFICIGCAQTSNVFTHTYQQIQISLRQAGEKMVAQPDATNKKYGCKPHQKPDLFVEQTEVLPNPVVRGGEINHRFTYALCPPAPSATVGGEIVRAVIYRGSVAFKDVAKHMFKPGTWVVDAFITIPPEAEPGVYALESTIKYGTKSLQQTNSFVVIEKPK
jgi:hypothetical protein